MTDVAFLESCMSPADLAKKVAAQPVWPASEAFLDAVSGAPQTVEELALWRRMSAHPWPAAAVPLVVRATGRGSAKTSDGAWLAAYHLLVLGEEHARRALAGTRVFVKVIAPRKKQAANAVAVYRAVFDQCKPLGLEYEVTAENSESIELRITKPARSVQFVVRVGVWDPTSERGDAVCFLHLPEFAHGWSGSEHVATDKALAQALLPRMSQFPRGQVYAESTNGPPRGQMFEWLQNPPKNAVVVRASTFVFNPTVDEATTREWVPDERAWKQEILCSIFGHAGEAFLDPELVGQALDVEDEWAKGAYGPESEVVCADLAALADYFAIAKCALANVEIAPGKVIRHVVVTHAEHHRGSKKQPIQLAAMARRIVALSEGKRPVVFDQHLAVELKAILIGAGYKEAKDVRELRGKRFLQMAMSAQAQTARFLQLREVSHGKRLHVQNTEHGRAMVDELAGLVAHELAQGLLRVEAGGSTSDDLADCCALGVEICLQGRLTPADPSGTSVVVVPGRVWIEAGVGVQVGAPRAQKVFPNGKRLPAEIPETHRLFDHYAREMLSQGISTPAIERWKQQNPNWDRS